MGPRQHGRTQTAQGLSGSTPEDRSDPQAEVDDEELDREVDGTVHQVIVQDVLHGLGDPQAEADDEATDREVGDDCIRS